MDGVAGSNLKRVRVALWVEYAGEGGRGIEAEGVKDENAKLRICANPVKPAKQASEFWGRAEGNSEA